MKLQVVHRAEGVSDDVNGAIIPVILSGGAGTRLWPYSTTDEPKQFLPLLHGGKSLFAQALDRVSDTAQFGVPFIVASIRHRAICERELTERQISAKLIFEPVGRNTAPAILAAAISAADLYGLDCLLLVMPSDHLIDDVAQFHAAVAMGSIAARDGKLVTFGIRPSAPETGYGYLAAGEEIAGCPGVKSVAQFIEKPSLDVAEAMVASGDYLWNAGIFLFSARAILREAKRVAPEILRCVTDALAAGERGDGGLIPDEALFATCASESIDCAVMERSSSVAVVPMSPGWSDLGSWDALASLVDKGQAIGPVTTLDCESCYIRTDGLSVAALGLKDLIVVAAAGRLLILPRGRSQEVKRLLQAMDSAGAPQ